ncbi:RES family NAD+ phosphorylase [Teichococcus rhizosphaerae]|nr:RES family NAD+ phosphorylase [Pseudoroseomonas rhizosphaerae]
MSGRLAPAPVPSHRLVPSRFPPIGLFDTVATAADMQAVMELAGWTNDRLVQGRIQRLPPDQWVHGRPNSSIVMAAFLHAPPMGGRFNGPDLGAWYAAAALPTAAAEVAHHLRREAVATGLPSLSRAYRAYTAELAGGYLDLRGQRQARPEIYAPGSHAASQPFGEEVRASGTDGILYDSLRHAGGTNVVAYRPAKILAVTQADHWKVTVEAASRRIRLHRLSRG